MMLAMSLANVSLLLMKLFLSRINLLYRKLESSDILEAISIKSGFDTCFLYREAAKWTKLRILRMNVQIVTNDGIGLYKIKIIWGKKGKLSCTNEY